MARILLVEDEPHIARVMSMWLSRNGHEIFEAENGAVALETLSKHPVDMIISDMNMPVLDGIGLVAAVRNERQMDIPFMLITARCDHAHLRTRLEPYGVTIYPKPFVPSRLVADIDEILGIVKT